MLMYKDFYFKRILLKMIVFIAFIGSDNTAFVNSGALYIPFPPKHLLVFYTAFTDMKAYFILYLCPDIFICIVTTLHRTNHKERGLCLTNIKSVY